VDRKRALVLVGDMPVMSYQTRKDEALRNAGRFFKEGPARRRIKLEAAWARQGSILGHRRGTGIRP
jgi:ketopantoate hydroxymethyltransferase